ncbi:Hypp5731 [Branchiostoma lanceolatum]|uniref:Hypp5731 protein n=1 Tax=Branchiostoma lanceolatum TaxID=7740 RepID=A0A8J9VYP5_BRALA|nr:Hypp5731 [Branchiostoma lanceolatum]
MKDLTQSFTDFYAQKVAKALEEGLPIEDVKVDLPRSVMKPLHASWLLGAINRVAAKRDVVVSYRHPGRHRDDAKCLVPAAKCIVPAAKCLIPTASSQLPSASYQLPRLIGAPWRQMSVPAAVIDQVYAQGNIGVKALPVAVFTTEEIVNNNTIGSEVLGKLDQNKLCAIRGVGEIRHGKGEKKSGEKAFENLVSAFLTCTENSVPPNPNSDPLHQNPNSEPPLNDDREHLDGDHEQTWKKKTLSDNFKETFHGEKRIPSFLYTNPNQSVEELNLQHLEETGSEAIYDTSNRFKNLLAELTSQEYHLK